MYRKITALVLGIVMCLSMLAGCTSASNQPAPPATAAAPSAATGAPAAPSAAPAASNAFETGPTYVFVAGQASSDTHPNGKGLHYMNEILQERSNGKMKMEIHSNSALGGERELTEAAMAGTIDIALSSCSPVTNFEPSFMIFDLPFLFETREDAHAALDSEWGRILLDRLERSNIKGIAFWETSFINLWSAPKILKHPDDIKGMTIRVIESEMYFSIMTALGANPVATAFAETYTALQTGVADGATIATSSGVMVNIQEVAPNYTEIGLLYLPTPFMMNLDLWNSLPPEYQDLIMECAAEACAKERQWMIEEEQTCHQKILDDNGTVTILTQEEKQPWIDVIKEPVWSKAVGREWSKAVGRVVLQEDVDFLEEFLASRN